MNWQSTGSKLLWLIFLFTCGCASSLEYFPPSPGTKQNNVVVINQPKETIWMKIVPALGREFFVIDHLDKDSGLLNISYSGDPQKYIDCGRIKSYLKNLRETKTYDFPAASAHIQYAVKKGYIFLVNRNMDLEGRINLIIEEINPEKTRISVNTRYLVTKTEYWARLNGLYPHTKINKMFFTSSGSGSFPTDTPPPVTCRSTGKLESDILFLLK